MTKKLGMTPCTMRQPRAQHIACVHNASTACMTHCPRARRVNRITACTMRQPHARHVNHVHDASTKCTTHRLHARRVNPAHDASPACMTRQPHAQCMVCVHYICMMRCSHDHLCVPFCVATASMPPASACMSVRACTCVCVCLRAYVSVRICVQACLHLRVHLLTY